MSNQKYDTKSLKKAIEKVHGNKFILEKTEYHGYGKKIILTCPEHGDFTITICHLLSGQGCPKCRYVKSAAGKRRSFDELISECRKVHGDTYDYSLVTHYKNDRIKYPIICPIHGMFMQTFNNHIKGKQGCPKCGRIKCDTNRLKTFDEFVADARKVHGDRYEYNDRNYHGNQCNIGITCKTHGVFYMRPTNHITLGQNCPRCANNDSTGEDEIYDFVNSLLSDKLVIKRKRGLLNNNEELDIYIPSYNFAIEYDGVYWHSECYRDSNYHLDKTKACNEQGIRLFHIFEDEWLEKPEIIKSMISNILNKTENKVYARKCRISEVEPSVASKFLDANHLQGRCGSKIRIGLYYEDDLVSLMTFGKSRHFVGNDNYQWELLRFCNKLNTTVIGGASKLFKYFVNTYHPDNIVSYADRRWSNGHVYDNLGFTKYNESKPNYYYVVNRARVYRFNLRKQVLIEKYGCPPEMTEREFCRSMKWWRIYDCGCLCYKWERNSMIS